MPCPKWHPLPSPFTGLHICVNYLHIEGQLKEAITQCGIASHVSCRPQLTTLILVKPTTCQPSQSVVRIMSYSTSGP